MISIKIPKKNDPFVVFGNNIVDNYNFTDEKTFFNKQMLKNKVEFNEAIILERNEEIEKIFKDVHDIDSIFRNLNKIVLEQSNQITTLEENIDSTFKKSEKAVESLKIAESYHKSWFSKRNKIILLSIAGLSINAPVTVLFGVKAGIISGLSTIGLSALTTIFTKN